MSVETLKTVSLVAYAISGVFFVITIWIFFRFHVSEIFGEITGISRRKAIRDIQNQSSEEKNGFYQSSYAKKKNTEKMARDSRKLSGRLSGRSGKLSGSSGKLGGHSGKIKGNSEELERVTSVLTEEERGQTAVLSEVATAENVRIPAEVMVVTEIILCDTDEVIV